MENSYLLEKEEVNNTKNYKGLPYFIIIEKSENKKIKIPCANELVAKRLLASYSKSK